MSERKVYKIVSLSSASAGLNSLFSKYCYKFDSISPFESIYHIGIDCYSKEITLPKGSCITFHFWKLSFQARFNFFLEKLVKDADAGFLMFNLKTKNSLKNIEMYIPIFRAHDPELPIILVGNKADLGKGDIEQEYLEQYLSRNNITSYYEISAKEDTNKNIELLFSDLAYLILKTQI
jgi:GTPase SAR1 family protein